MPTKATNALLKNARATVAVAAVATLAFSLISSLMAHPTNSAARLRKEADQIVEDSYNSGLEELSCVKARNLLVAARIYKFIGDTNGATNAWRSTLERAAELLSKDLVDKTPVEKAKAIYYELGEAEEAEALQARADSASSSLKRALEKDMFFAVTGAVFLYSAMWLRKLKRNDPRA